MGAGLQTSVGLRKKKDVIVPKKARLSELLVGGFDINQLIQEYIVPIDGIICTHHVQADGERGAADGERESGHAQVRRVNELLRNLKYRRRGSFVEFEVPLAGPAMMTLSMRGIGSAMLKHRTLMPRAARGLGKAMLKDRPVARGVVRRLATMRAMRPGRPRPPPEDLEYHPEICRVALCRAYMYGAEMDAGAQQDASRIGMTIHGYLFLPPFETSDRLGEDPPKKVLRLYPPEVELARSASKVAIEVPAYLHDPNAADDILGLLGAEDHVSQVAPLRITCRHVAMARHSDKGGDPVLDAWLPVSDIEHQIEFMLNEHMSEKLWHPD